MQRGKLRVFNVMVVMVLMLLAGGSEAAWGATSFGVSAYGTAGPEGNGYRYNYTIYLTELPFDFQASDLVFGIGGVVLTLPLFDADAISDIQQPPGWNHSVDAATAANWQYDSNTDPDADSYDAPASAFENPSHVLRWFGSLDPTSTDVKAEFEVGISIPGFSFFSDYGPGNGPITVTLIDLNGGTEVTAADPPLPSSPGSPFHSVPEPATAGLGLLGLAALALGATRRRGA